MKKFNMIHLKSQLRNPLSTFIWFERFLAVFCTFIPVILRLTDKTKNGDIAPAFRNSISHYVYMAHSYVFGLLLGAASLLFIFNGTVYFKNENKDRLNLDTSGKWYNVLLGISLLGVLILPCNEYPYTHFTFAGAFFLGNALVTIFIHRKDWRKSNITIGILMVAALGLYFTKLFPWLTLFWAEWASLIVVGIHFYLETLEK